MNKEEIRENFGLSNTCEHTVEDRINSIDEAMEKYATQQCAAKDAENERLKEEKKSILAAVARGDDLAFSLAFDGELSQKQKKDAEIDRLKGLIEKQEEEENNPYWYWPICDVDGCDGVSCRGGGVWEETGYWSVCPKHSQEFRDGKPQPKMKQSSIDREATRDEDGCLPYKND